MCAVCVCAVIDAETLQWVCAHSELVREGLRYLKPGGQAAAVGDDGDGGELSLAQLEGSEDESEDDDARQAFDRASHAVLQVPMFPMHFLSSLLACCGVVFLPL